MVVVGKAVVLVDLEANKALVDVLGEEEVEVVVLLLVEVYMVEVGAVDEW